MVEGETAVHAPLRPARGVVGAIHVVVLGPGQVLRVLPEVIQVTSAVRSQTTDLPFRSCWVEDNVVDGLDELQLDDALHGEDREEFVLLRRAALLGGHLTWAVTVVARRRIPDISVYLQQQAGVH